MTDRQCAAICASIEHGLATLAKALIDSTGTSTVKEHAQQLYIDGAVHLLARCDKALRALHPSGAVREKKGNP